MVVAFLSQNLLSLSLHSKSKSNTSHQVNLHCHFLPPSQPSKLFSHKPKPSLITLLQDYNFSPDQLDSILLHKRYNLLSRKGFKTVKPKIDQLLKSGFSRDELIKIISIDPNILSSSHERRLIPNLNLLKSLLGSDELVKKAIFRYGGLLVEDLEKRLKPNVETLISKGVPFKWVTFSIVDCPKALASKPDKFASAVKELESMGFDPSLGKFVLALKAKITLSQSVWKRRLSVYKSFGWSDEDFNSAFLKRPLCMLTSEQKIKKMMHFYVEKLSWDPFFLSEQPFYVSVSLEDRVIPRCKVLNVLAEKGLLDVETELHRLFVPSKVDFEEKFVKRFENRVPDIVEVYRHGVGEDFGALRAWQERNEQTAVRPRKRKVQKDQEKTDLGSSHA